MYRPTIAALKLAFGPLLGLLLSACAAQPNPIPQPTQVSSTEQQVQAMQQRAEPEQLVLRRKIAIARFTNETLHGKSFLRDDHNNALGKQVSDMLAQRLIESGEFLVMERPDLIQLSAEASLTDRQLQLTGADTLILGSLVEFGRTTEGTVGFWSKSKTQKAKAKIALRLVDPSNGLAYFSASGTGQASTETGEIAFVGSTAAYDSTLGDRAIASAITEVVSDIIANLKARPWSTRILATEGDKIFISGGKLQGLQVGQKLIVMTEGKAIKSAQTGFVINLPGEKIAELTVVSTFGNDETNEGSVAKLTLGELGNHSLASLLVIGE